MEELLTLREHLEARNYEAALAIVNELEEMSREDKINKIFSFSIILLQHIIKKKAENRITSSWEASIKEASIQIKRINSRRKAGGNYLTEAELRESLEEAFPVALAKAASEAFGGAMVEKELLKKINKKAILKEALKIIS